MTNPPAIQPTISTLLDEFFASYKATAPAPLRARIARVRDQLPRDLEAEGPRVLTTAQLAILNDERQFSSSDAFVRTMHADDLYYALPLCLDPAHALEGSTLRETQLDVIAALAEWLWRRRLVSGRDVSECAIIEFDIAMRRARDLIRAERHAVRRAEAQ
jgi:hypothetical protein